VVTPSTSRHLTPTDPTYPSGFLDLEEPPSLFVRGEIAQRPMVAIVGTRKCTRYGVELAESCGRALAELDWPVVSGLARGIDAAAHRGMVGQGGRGIVILGSGIGQVYPRENSPLLEEILSLGGAVLSEYEDDTPPDRWRFPARNRLIAAIASAVVVVESALTGGSQITAVLAAEIGRPVFAFPGDVDRPASVGTNRLIRDGAIPVLGSRDLVDELALIPGFEARPVPLFEAGVPVDGIEIDDLPELWNCSISEVLSRIGRAESSGHITRDGTRVFLKPDSSGGSG
jgi:DNA processing protein